MNRNFLRPLVMFAAILGATALVRPALANPMALPFTYLYPTLPKGEAELEQYADLTPVKAYAPGNILTPYLATQFQTEFEYGITDHLELGLYFALQPSGPDGYTGNAHLTEGTGSKQRLRYRFAEEGELPIDLAVYGEVVEFDTEVELELKLLLQKRLGNLVLAANLWGEVEKEYATNPGTVSWIANPTLGATYQITPTFHLGVEGWMRAEWPSVPPATRAFELGPHEFVGPAVLLDFGRIWWSTGVYARVDDLTRDAQAGDNSGPVWVRTVVGFGL